MFRIRENDMNSFYGADTLNKLPQAAVLQACIQEMPISSLQVGNAFLSPFHVFPQSLKTVSSIVPQLHHGCCLPIPIQSITCKPYYLFIVIWSEMFTASSNNKISRYLQCNLLWYQCGQTGYFGNAELLKFSLQHATGGS